MNEAILLLAHGAPADEDDIERYVADIRHGRALAPELLQNIKDRYRLIGGSPLLKHTQSQAEELQKRLGNVPVFIGMRHSSPRIREAVDAMINLKIHEVLVICMAPQFSALTIGAYQKALEDAIGERKLNFQIVKSYAQHPGLIRAFAKKLQDQLDSSPDSYVIFTAHSLPARVLQQQDPYDYETKRTACLIAQTLNLRNWVFAYQSQGLTTDPWLGPTVEARIDELAGKGIQKVIVQPVGFVCDHVEILYDVDIMYRDYAGTKQVNLARAESLNNSPEFMDLLVDLARSGGIPAA